MENKLIKITDTHYVVANDGPKTCVFYGYKGGKIGMYKLYGKYFKNKAGGIIDEDSYLTVTHSTKPLEGGTKIHGVEHEQYLTIKYLDLAEVDEIVSGYSIYSIADRMGFYDSAEDNKGNRTTQAFIEGFNAHKELSKDKLFTPEFILHIVPMVLEKQQKLNATDFNDWYNSDFLRMLFPKTEWYIEFDRQGKIILI